MRLVWCCLVFLSFIAPAQNVTFQEPFPGITFTAPVELLSPPDQSNRLFLVQQNGLIKVFPNKKGLQTTDVKGFLNLSSRLIFGGERGLLGMAFHPQFATNGFVYVHYTRPSPLTSVVSRFTVKADNGNEADPDSELILLTQAQPYENHNGGKIAFGNDGYLYISIGDGGSAGDPQNYAQNLTTLLGKILRVDVDQPEGELNYRIPADNPFKNNTQGYREEIFAYGLRNVWKFSVDHATGNIWAADVGQNSREEINLIVNGGNYGWRLMEGTLCYNPSTNCNPGGLTMPIYEYPHANNNRSVTGGHVYRGIQIPEWQGQYIYGDYISGRIWRLLYENNQATNELVMASGGLISSFGEDRSNELYVLQYSAGSTGKVFRFFPSPPEAPHNLVLTNLQGSNKLNWDDLSNNELGFIIERSPKDEIGYEVIDTVAYNTTEYIDQLGEDETPDVYRVKAYNDGGESDYAYTASIILRAEVMLFSKLKIFPNPCEGSFMIELQEISSPASIRVFNLMKQEVFSTLTEESIVSVELAQPPPGLYLVEIQNRFGSVVRKVIIR